MTLQKHLKSLRKIRESPVLKVFYQIYSLHRWHFYMTNLYLMWLIKRFIKGKVVQKLFQVNYFRVKETICLIY